MRLQLHIVRALLLLAAVPPFARVARAQDATVMADALTQGFHADRNYFSPEPFEYFDPVTGNIILTFTDLTLPGNAGRELRFQRTFNNLRSIGGPEAVSRWTFGFPGMVMRVIEQQIIPGFDYEDDLQRVLMRTPRLVMADGSEQSTVFVQRPSTDTSDTQTWRWVRSGAWFEYDIESHQMWMPDGTLCQYDANGLLVGFTDPFGNDVTLDRSTPGFLVVAQEMGHDPPRVVTFTLDGDDRPTQMEFLGRLWQYTYGAPDQGVRDIESVTLPVSGSGWTFTCAPGDLTTITTPSMGQISYTYEDKTIYHPLFPAGAGVRRSPRAQNPHEQRAGGHGAGHVDSALRLRADRRHVLQSDADHHAVRGVRRLRARQHRAAPRSCHVRWPRPPHQEDIFTGRRGTGERDAQLRGGEHRGLG